MATEIQIVNPGVLSRIESFMNDSAYREAIENSANYNTRLCIERRMRMPFLDPQTERRKQRFNDLDSGVFKKKDDFPFSMNRRGIAQNHSNLFMSARQRLPGLNEGQVYTYPSKRWRKKRRQYLMMPNRRKDIDGVENSEHVANIVESSVLANSEDSKDSSGLKDDATAKVQDAWFYDELDLQAMDGFDEPDQDSDYDYEETYTKRRKRRGAGGKQSKPSESTKKTKAAATPGRGRKKGMQYAADPNDTDKPFSCDLCGARYKTRPGLTYHYTHSHKEGKCAAVTGEEEASSDATTASAATTAAPAPPTPPPQESSSSGWQTPHYQDSYLTFLNTPGATPVKKQTRSNTTMGGTPGPSVVPEEPPATRAPPSPKPIDKIEELPPMPVLTMEQQNKEKATPSPYCDFCLGDAVANKKSGQPEELVSCSDCGRSGHPTCLQFTANMIVSVRKYRWQCIECKCCSICGTSDNDDQLLFCDDCDRGYHMYCLAPPLTTPPEGSWSCRLCLSEFHRKALKIPVSIKLFKESTTSLFSTVTEVDLRRISENTITSCSCSSKCLTKKCVCRRNKVKCDVRCHFPLLCENE
ncbi:zinc finger protein neuro-d4-like isoform X2 [Macrosteles quadrilineatus]|uniref:zinc finger protein neuro-d4-like isoform X2 n=1 Tax=Macrosteles quadrilineatus TaxID=74068 RepID=UPI0023E329D5|nr:zinc finger protein neuro-d4-like isoform X2 [Macrosteles quadrilineatus]